MANAEDFLIELGVEELPTGAVPKLVNDFAALLTKKLKDAGLTHGRVATYTTPRRIAVFIEALSTQQPRTQVLRKGPAVEKAFTHDGKPTPAALGFARSCAVDINDCERIEEAKGQWLCVKQTQGGEPTRALLPSLLQTALRRVPLPKRMRWAEGNDEFIRPVHWVCCLLGSEVIEVTLLGVTSDAVTYGHRFHAPQAIHIEHAREYNDALAKQGYVIADWQARRDTIAHRLREQARATGAEVVMPGALLDEVTHLVEWPVVLQGRFDEDFLRLPREVLCAVMNAHQKCFALTDKTGTLQARFLLVSNIESANPSRLIEGNERVMRARMSDGAFFFDADSKRTLASRVDALANVAYVRGLGSLRDKAQRLAGMSEWLAAALGENTTQASQAGLLAKTDLLTDMVGEFPELQGVMGYYYAKADGVGDALACALRSQYLPTGAGSALPDTRLGACLALADKLDTLIGIFGINKPPSGDKDPFALRRCALGIIAIILTQSLDIDLQACLQQARSRYTQSLPNAHVVEQVLAFIFERLRGWYQDKAVPVDCLNAVLAKSPTHLLDCAQRIDAVNVFRQLPAASALAAANKRVSRLLIKEDSINIAGRLNPDLFEFSQEQQLAEALAAKSAAVQPYLAKREYTRALKELATLQNVIDNFFDHVMVMVDDEAKRRNRLALLAELRELFLQVADISLLQ